MFWKREKAAALHPIEETIKQRPCRFCILYISERFKHIMFVPQGKIDIGIYAEIDDVISDVWPCEFGKLQENIEVTLNRHKDFTDYVKGNWPSYKNSKAKSQKSFETDYIAIHLRTDLSKDYGERELERIIVTAWPDPISNTYYITGTNHLYDTKIAQIVCDIFEACLKIRN